MNWPPRATHVLRDELKNIQVTISSDYSPDLAEALVRGRLDVAFLRIEPGFDLCYEVVDSEPLIVLMPSDHRLASREAIHPREFVGEIFIGGSRHTHTKASVLAGVTEDYLQRLGLNIKLMGWTTWRWPYPWLRPPAGWRSCPPMRRICCRGPWSAVRWRVKRQRSIWPWVTAKQTPRRFSSCSYRASTNWWGRTRSTDAAPTTRLGAVDGFLTTNPPMRPTGLGRMLVYASEQRLTGAGSKTDTQPDALPNPRRAPRSERSTNGSDHDDVVQSG